MKKVEILNKLVETFLNHFSADEFRRFIAYTEENLAVKLPGGNVSHYILVEEGIKILLNENKLDDNFFKLWISERPRRKSEVEYLRQIVKTYYEELSKSYI